MEKAINSLEQVFAGMGFTPIVKIILALLIAAYLVVVLSEERYRNDSYGTYIKCEFVMRIIAMISLISLVILSCYELFWI